MTLKVISKSTNPLENKILTNRIFYPTIEERLSLLDSIKPNFSVNRDLDAGKVAAIKKKIQETGEIKPLFMDKGGLVDGHHRYAALKELEAEMVPVFYFDGDLKNVPEFVLRALAEDYGINEDSLKVVTDRDFEKAQKRHQRTSKTGKVFQAGEGNQSVHYSQEEFTRLPALKKYKAIKEKAEEITNSLKIKKVSGKYQSAKYDVEGTPYQIQYSPRKVEKRYLAGRGKARAVDAYVTGYQVWDKRKTAGVDREELGQPTKTIQDAKRSIGFMIARGEEYFNPRNSVDKSLFEDIKEGKVTKEDKEKMKHMGERVATQKEVKDQWPRSYSSGKVGQVNRKK